MSPPPATLAVPSPLPGGAGVRVRFWGVRGSIPAPGPHTVRYGGNTACVSVDSPGHDLFVFDAGSGIRELGLALIRDRRQPLRLRLLLTHTHWDHIQGFPFFGPAFAPGNDLHVYGITGTGDSLRETLSGQMLHRYFPISLERMGAALEITNLTPGTYAMDNARVRMDEVQHTGPTVSYRLEIGGYAIAYVTDSEPPGGPGDLTPDPRCLRLAEDADVLIHDAQYTDAEYPAKVGWGHSPLGYVVDLALAARAKRLYLFHHDPTRSDDQVDAMVASARERALAAKSALRVAAASEGLEIVLPARAERATPASREAIAAG